MPKRTAAQRSNRDLNVKSFLRDLKGSRLGRLGGPGAIAGPHEELLRAMVTEVPKMLPTPPPILMREAERHLPEIEKLFRIALGRRAKQHKIQQRG